MRFPLIGLLLMSTNLLANEFKLGDFCSKDSPYKCPVHFYKDVNFDGKLDKIITYHNQAQRHRHAYEIYEQNEDRKWVLLNAIPFDNIDSQTVFNPSEKTIKTHDSGGACIYTETTYKIINKIPEPHKIVIADNFDVYGVNVGCTRYTYGNFQKITDENGNEKWDKELLSVWRKIK